MDSSILTLGKIHFLYKGCLVSFLLLSCSTEISELNANSVDHGQILHSEASYLSAHCLPMSLLWDVRLKWVKIY